MLSTGRRCDGRGAFGYFRARACAGDGKARAAGACLRLGFAGGDIRSGQRLGHGAARDRIFPRAALYQRRAGGAVEPDSGARARKPFGFTGRHAAVLRQSGHGGAVFSGAAGSSNRPHGRKNRRARALDRDLDRKSGKLHARKIVFRAFSRFYMLFQMDRARKMAYNTRA